MKPAIYDTFAVTVEASGYSFRASTSSVAFPGFLNVYTADEEVEDKNNYNFSGIEKNAKLKMDDSEMEAAFYRATCTFYRSYTGTCYGGKRNWTSFDLCTYHINTA
jgi:Topoisomerase IA